MQDQMNDIYNLKGDENVSALDYGDTDTLFLNWANCYDNHTGSSLNPSDEYYSSDVPSEEAKASGNSSSPSSSISANKPLKKKYFRDRRVIRVPKLVKDDIRHSYNLMLWNVMNSGDANFLAAFLQEFSTPTATMTKSFDKEMLFQMGLIYPLGSEYHFPSVEKSLFDMRSVEMMAMYWGLLFQITPDLILQDPSARIVTYSTTDTCRIICECNVYLTHIYQLHPLQLLDLILTKYFGCDNSSQVSLIGKKRKATAEFPNVTDEFQSIYGLSLSLLPQPRSVKLTGRLIMKVNENKFIESYQFELGNPIFIQ